MSIMHRTPLSSRETVCLDDLKGQGPHTHQALPHTTDTTCSDF